MAGRYSAAPISNNVVDFPNSGDKKEMSDAEVKKISRANKPRGLKKEEQQVWDRVVPEMIRAGRFKALYVEFFKNYCVVVARMEDFLDYLNDEKNTWKYSTEGRNGVQHKTRPEAAQYNDDWRKWNSLINQMGMSPATDQRFHSMQPDLFDDLY